MRQWKQISIVASALFAFPLLMLEAKDRPSGVEAPALDRVLSPDQLQDDVRFVFDSIEQVHPDPYFFTDRADILPHKQALMSRLASAATVADFYRDVAAFVAGYREDHTEAVRPPGLTPLRTPINHTYLWKFRVLPDRVGYLDFTYMTDRPAWQKFLAQTFAEAKDEQLVGLIIDLRTNTGGDSRLGDDLLTYLTDKPYRSITSKAWRFSLPYLAQLPEIDPWGFASVSPDEEPPADFQLLFRQRPYAPFRRALRERAPARTKQVVARWARHWLEDGGPSDNETETLTLSFSALTIPPADLPLRFRGPVAFLIAPDTFSSAVILANTVEDNQLASLVGEETKPCNQFGEACHVTLPNSRLKLAIATAKYIRANGDATDRRGVRPTVAVSPSTQNADLAHDAVVLRAQKLIHDQVRSRK